MQFTDSHRRACMHGHLQPKQLRDLLGNHKCHLSLAMTSLHSNPIKLLVKTHSSSVRAFGASR